MSNDVHIAGLKELQAFLDALPAKLERNVMRGALRAGAKVIQAQAIANVPVKSGELRKSLKLRTGGRNGIVTASVRTKVFYAKFVEYGTASHAIRAKHGGKLLFGGTFRDSVHHPGTKPKSFLRPALDAKAGAAVIAAAEYMRNRLATKEGLDTADIQIGIEE